eukprot:Phypoly_transcript_16844.p2 GENE.Phypoly_transcript_16844~~Phypoly_transcript_16844.p2  ORF type:complete len:126 (+),score=17.05 Phypoly_transcript_16844:71-448(+)
MDTQYGDYMAGLHLTELKEQFDLITSPSAKEYLINSLAIEAIEQIRTFLNSTNENDLGSDDNESQWLALEEEVEEYIKQLKQHASRQQTSQRDHSKPLHRGSSRQTKQTRKQPGTRSQSTAFGSH